MFGLVREQESVLTEGDSSARVCRAVSGSDGSGSHYNIAHVIIWAADHGLDVINLSLGGLSGSSTLESAVNHAYDNGVPGLPMQQDKALSASSQSDFWLAFF